MLIFTILLISISRCCGQIIYSNDLHFRVEPGGRTCFFESAKTGDLMEVYYQVLDGQHGDLDISLDVFDPAGDKLLTDYKKSENAIIKEVALTGDYEFCLDNSFSSLNSKMVFIYVLVDTQEVEEVTTEAAEDLHWQGLDENGATYYVGVDAVADSLTRTLKQVVKARHMLDLYRASKSRDSYLALHDILVVDLWSSFQITVMFIVAMLQVFMIKKLFRSRSPY